MKLELTIIRSNIFFRNDTASSNLDEAIANSSVAPQNEETSILVKNEPDTESGGICIPQSLIPIILSIKDESETDSEVDIDDDNYCPPNSSTHNDTSILEIPVIKDEPNSDLEIDVATPSTSQNISTVKSASVVNGPTVTNESSSKFTVKCQTVGKCKDLFECWEAMHYHVQTYHARTQKDNTFECHLCKKRLGEKQSHQRHMNLYHFGKSLFKCSFGTCSKSFPRQDYLEKHINAEHTRKNLFKCPKCPMEFTFKNNQLHHLSYAHSIGVSYACYICKKKLGEKRSLLDHMNSIHNGRFSFKCPVCSKGFVSKKRLKRHLQRVRIICGKTTAGLEFLKKLN